MAPDMLAGSSLSLVNGRVLIRVEDFDNSPQLSVYLTIEPGKQLRYKKSCQESV